MAHKEKIYHLPVLKLLGGVGYFTVFVEWFALLALYAPKFIESDLGKVIFPKAEPQPVPEPVVVSTAHKPSGLLTVLVMLAALAFIVLILYVIFAKYIPGASKAAEKVTHVATERAVPIIAHKPVGKIPARKRKVLTERVLFWAKILLVVVPLATITVGYIAQNTLEAQLIVLSYAVVSSIAVASFVLQRALFHRWFKQSSHQKIL